MHNSESIGMRRHYAINGMYMSASTEGSIKVIPIVVYKLGHHEVFFNSSNDYGIVGRVSAPVIRRLRR